MATICAAAIWKKYSPAERKLWKKLYGGFVEELYALGLVPEDIAHNLAVRAVFEMREI
jgi:hypothetical protein